MGGFKALQRRQMYLPETETVPEADTRDLGRRTNTMATTLKNEYLGRKKGGTKVLVWKTTLFWVNIMELLKGMGARGGDSVYKMFRYGVTCQGPTTNSI